MDQTNKKHRVKVVFHIPIPSESNGVGADLQTCIKQHENKSGSIVPWLSVNNPTENSDIIDGKVYEHMETVDFANAKSDSTVKRSQLDGMWTSLNILVVNKIRNIFEWWGLDRDVP
jgi:hypothetical protein